MQGIRHGLMSPWRTAWPVACTCNTMRSMHLQHEQHHIVAPSHGSSVAAAAARGTEFFAAQPSGARLAYERVPAAPLGGHTGDTPPALLFCNGLQSARTGLKAQAVLDMAREQGCEGVLFDYQGHGQSSGDLTSCGIGDWLGDALAVLDTVVQAPRVVLIGSSIGGWVALRLALLRPSRISDILLIAPAIDITEEHWRWLGPAAQAQVAAGKLVTLSSPYLNQADGALGFQVGRPFFEQAAGHLLLQLTCTAAMFLHPPETQNSHPDGAESATLGRPETADCTSGPKDPMNGAGDVPACALTPAMAAQASASSSTPLGLPAPAGADWAQQVQCRVVVMHGDADDCVPLSTSLRLFCALAGAEAARVAACLAARGVCVKLPGLSTSEESLVVSTGSWDDGSIVDHVPAGLSFTGDGAPVLSSSDVHAALPNVCQVLGTASGHQLLAVLGGDHRLSHPEHLLLMRSLINSLML